MTRVDPAKSLLEAFISGRIEVDFGGHYRLPAGPLTPKILQDTFGEYWERAFRRIVSRVDLVLILGSHIHGPTGIDIVEDFSKALEHLRENNYQHITIGSRYDALCSECGGDVEVLFDGQKIFVDKPCSEPGGLKPWDIYLDVPSGKLVFRNDMRRLFPTKKDFEINFRSEVKKCEEHYASLGMFHFFVGNTSPGVYVLPNKTVTVGNYYNFNTNRERNKKHRKGSICTDLWWVSACDYDKFIQLGGVVKTNYPQDVVVDMPDGPGRYRLTSRGSVVNRDTESEYAIIRKA